MTKPFARKNLPYHIPPIGIIIFIGLFVYSSTLYPGGSQANLSYEGFDWINNYWCNLMNENAMNGVVNPARPFAIAAMIILCLSLMTFFIRFGNHNKRNKFWSKAIIYGGILSMISAIFMFTKFHDEMTIVSSFFGLFAVIGISLTVYKSNSSFYKITGLICAFLLLLNNIIYYSEGGISYLPLLQKLTFLVVLLWIIGLNQKLRKKPLPNKASSIF